MGLSESVWICMNLNLGNFECADLHEFDSGKAEWIWMNLRQTVRIRLNLSESGLIRMDMHKSLCIWLSLKGMERNWSETVWIWVDSSAAPKSIWMRLRESDWNWVKFCEPERIWLQSDEEEQLCVSLQESEWGRANLSESGWILVRLIESGWE